MNTLPSMDSQKIERGSNGVVSIKTVPILPFAVAGAALLFSIVPLSRGEFVLGIAGIAAGVIIFARAKGSAGATFEFDPNTREFRIGPPANTTIIPFDEITAFGFSTQKESGSFTREEIMVILKGDRAIQIGVITDANEKNRAEKVSNMIKFLYETTGINPSVEEGV